MAKSFPLLSTLSSYEDTDITSNQETSAILNLGVAAHGVVSSTGDHDWYKVHLQKGRSYTFASIGIGSDPLVNTYLNLWNNSGEVVASDDDSGPGQSSIIGMSSTSSGLFTANYTGIYFIDVGSYNDNGQGNYGVSFVESSSANGYKPSFDISMGAGSLFTDAAGPAVSWKTVKSLLDGQSVVLTYSFRDSVTYADDGSPTFLKCSTSEINSIRSALNLYSSICNITFNQVSEETYSNQADIVIASYNDPKSAAGAYGYFPAGDEEAGDLWLNESSIRGSIVPGDEYSWSAVLHEVGHTLGLSHPGDYDAGDGKDNYSTSAQFAQDSGQFTLMSYWDGNNTGQLPGIVNKALTPQMLDIYELQQLYGVNSSTRTENTTYGFNNTTDPLFLFSAKKTPYYCIWDAGGSDTIDASLYSTTQLIDLNDGHFSNIGRGKLNVSIAVGTIIENAVGGKNKDIIIGNNFDNVINGGMGSDTLTGGFGADLFIVGKSNSALIMDLGNGDDKLQIAKGGVANATITADWNASSATLNYGVMNLTTNGFNANLAAVIEGSNGAKVKNTGEGVTITGSKFADTIIGGTDADTLIGGLGNDTLTGSGGVDKFVFDTIPNSSTNKDLITDFRSGADVIQLSKLIFNSAFEAGTDGIGDQITATEFYSGSGITRAITDSQHFIYNSKSGALYYDSDGSGAEAAVQIAILGKSSHPSLSFTDLRITS